VSRRKVVSAMVLFGALVSIGSATPATRVVGGTTIQIQDAPWTVFVEQDRGLDEYVCTGSIIDPTHVLTAAHCVYAVDGTRAEASDLTVKAGVSNFST
jgi:secreted trypsin-like serine protease